VSVPADITPNVRENTLANRGLIWYKQNGLFGPSFLASFAAAAAPENGTLPNAQDQHKTTYPVSIGGPGAVCPGTHVAEAESALRDAVASRILSADSPLVHLLQEGGDSADTIVRSIRRMVGNICPWQCGRTEEKFPSVARRDEGPHREKSRWGDQRSDVWSEPV
jgi:hypothetical protein